MNVRMNERDSTCETFIPEAAVGIKSQSVQTQPNIIYSFKNMYSAIIIMLFLFIVLVQLLLLVSS